MSSSMATLFRTTTAAHYIDVLRMELEPRAITGQRKVAARIGRLLYFNV